MTNEAPRYLRFLAAVVLGSAAAAALAACGEDEHRPPIDASPPPADAMVDADTVVDGPLSPPDLPRLEMA